MQRERENARFQRIEPDRAGNHLDPAFDRRLGLARQIALRARQRRADLAPILRRDAGFRAVRVVVRRRRIRQAECGSALVQPRRERSHFRHGPIDRGIYVSCAAQRQTQQAVRARVGRARRPLLERGAHLSFSEFRGARNYCAAVRQSDARRERTSHSGQANTERRAMNARLRTTWQ